MLTRARLLSLEVHQGSDQRGEEDRHEPGHERWHIGPGHGLQFINIPIIFSASIGRHLSNRQSEIDTMGGSDETLWSLSSYLAVRTLPVGVAFTFVMTITDPFPTLVVSLTRTSSSHDWLQWMLISQSLVLEGVPFDELLGRIGDGIAAQSVVGVLLVLVDADVVNSKGGGQCATESSLKATLI
jgi:hypothetical protein